MIKAIPMEDWLRGCVYHDGRHGTVTLPTDKVLQIANYIQRTRRSVSDGLIDLAVEPRITGKHIDQIIIDEAVAEQTEPSTDKPTLTKINQELNQDPLHDDCFDCDKFFTCDNKGEDYKTDCSWK